MICRFCKNNLSEKEYGSFRVCVCGQHDNWAYETIDCPRCGNYCMYIEPHDESINDKLLEMQNSAMQVNKQENASGKRILWLTETIQNVICTEPFKRNLLDHGPELIINQI